MNSCDVDTCRLLKNYEGLYVVGKATVRNTSDSSRRVKRNLVTFLYKGVAISLPGPGGYDAISKDVTFNCCTTIDEFGIVRIVFNSSCIPLAGNK